MESTVKRDFFDVISMPHPTFDNIKVGDKVLRKIGKNGPESIMTVTQIKKNKIICNKAWSFDKKTGAEIDKDLRWGPPPLITGSYLVLS